MDAIIKTLNSIVEDINDSPVQRTKDRLITLVTYIEANCESEDLITFKCHFCRNETTLRKENIVKNMLTEREFCSKDCFEQDRFTNNF